MLDEPATGQPTPRSRDQVLDAGAEYGTCPFLRSLDDDGVLGAPIIRPDKANRCVALGDAAPQSLRQQRRACLSSAHVNCPRFVRGATEIAGPAVSTHRSGFALTPAVIGALLVLAASFALSVGFIVANGGMALSVAPSGDVKTAVESTAANVEPSIAPTAAPPASSLAVTASSAPSAQPSIAPTPEPSDAATVAPTIASTPLPSSDRYALLEPCPDAPDCWIYVIRGGDNLVSIARYFGIPLATVTELNPWTESTQLVAGQKLRLPAPAR